MQNQEIVPRMERNGYQGSMRVMPVKENFDLKSRGILSILNHGILELSCKSTCARVLKIRGTEYLLRKYR